MVVFASATCTRILACRPIVPRLKILVAEDEQSIRVQYRIILEARGHSVTATADGEECITAYRRALEPPGVPFDAVILDYRMPRLDGLGAARQILELCGDQRIIFASAYVAETLRQAARELHRIVELLQKPFGLDYLVEVVEDTEVYGRLASLNVKVRQLHDHNLSLSQL